MDILSASVRDLKVLYARLPVPGVEMRRGFYRAQFIGPWWMRLSGAPTLAITGLPGWQGKRFLTENTGTNVLRRGGRIEERLHMTVEPVTSWVDGSVGLALRYGSEAPAPWRWVRDELRMVDGSTLLGITFVDKPLIRHFPFPFLLVRESEHD
ncbi:MAG: hypothetical protein ACK4SX_08595 [Alcanivoracaceae bacterium]